MRTWFQWVVIPTLALGLGCRGDKDDTPAEDTAGEVDTTAVDSDGDGFVDDEDCNDSNAGVNPGAIEICDGVDNDCDDEVDEDVLTTYYADTDEDGYGDETNTSEACTVPTGYVTNGNDCDDSTDDAYPGNLEVCDDIDNDCDGDIDEEVSYDWYADADSDGYGDPDNQVESCQKVVGYVLDDTDCDDSAPDAWPGNTEVCDEIDNDCDGDIDEAVSVTWYQDVDGDGYGDNTLTQEACTEPLGYSGEPGDCDDTRSTVYPGADEYCNELDDDCDGTTDEDESLDVATWYQDADSDSYGDPDVSDIDCNQPTGYVSDNTDCDPLDSAQYPGADEYCNLEDDDCDGDVDEDESVDVITWYLDYDEDGYGDPLSPDDDCYQPTGYVLDNTDCDPLDEAQYPGADEYCNLEDDDCDGDTDEDGSLDVLTWYEDGDGDGYGDPDSTDIDCYQPTGYVADDTDCDPTDSAQYPSADEYCNSEDDDCDGDIDEDESVDVLTWYLDGDADGYGDPAIDDIDCYQPTGYVSDNTDCDPSDATQYPGAVEYCNLEDDDCDGDTDEDGSLDVLTWYADGDGDGFGDASVTDIDCYQPSGYVSDDTDCDPADGAQYPGADEYCNGEDDDCDGDIDEDGSLDVLTWYADVDSDGFGDASVSDVDCYQPSGYVLDSTDCDPDDAAQYPEADEYCNGEDDDCDGTVDEDDSVDAPVWYADDDADGYGDAASPTNACSVPSGYLEDDTDCDDGDNDVYPGADEYCNEEDDDCDGTIDEDDAVDAPTWYLDADEDGTGDPDSTYVSCSVPSGYVDNTDDCDDSDASESPFDAYEDSAGYGDTCVEPVNEWSTLDDSGSTTISIEGRIHDTDDEDWYYVGTTQSVTTSGTNIYDLQIDLVAGTDDYAFVVYQNGCSESTDLECDDGGTEGEGYTEFDYYAQDKGLYDHSVPSPATYCSTSSTYNDCDDLSGDIYIHVFRSSSSTDDCATYELEITNG